MAVATAEGFFQYECNTHCAYDYISCLLLYSLSLFAMSDLEKLVRFCNALYGHRLSLTPDAGGECRRVWLLYDVSHRSPTQCVRLKSGGLVF